MRRKGFTLVELLVVVAIIVIMAGILYPVFASTRRAAYNANCLSNLKQVGLAVNMYAQDYDETFPAACDQIDRLPQVGRAQPSNFPESVTPYAWDVVKPYVKNEHIWRCPGDAGFSNEAAGINIPNVFRMCGSSYRYNTALAWVDPDPRSTDPVRRNGNYWAPLTIGAIQKPTTTYVFAEPSGFWHNAIQAPPPSQRTAATDTRNTYHFNAVHVDGHVQAVPNSFANDRVNGWNRPRENF
jgi:prepilin-type N-terminal cleavage/methylation domain-containing protein